MKFGGRATILAIAAPLLFGGCASRLEVWDQTHEIGGLPFKATELYVKEGEHDKLKEGGECARTAFYETASLPTGATYYLNVHSGQLAKTAFAVKFGANGEITELTLNSEPSSETVKALTAAVTSIAPLLGVAPAKASSATEKLTASSVKPCDTGEVNVRYSRFEDFNRSRR